MDDKKRVILAGSTGLTGGYILSELKHHPAISQVYCTFRKEPAENQISPVKPILFNPLANQIEAFPQADIAFCCIGTTMAKAKSQKVFREADVDFVIAFAREAKNSGVRTFALQSSVGADASSSNFYLACKGEAEEAIHKMDFDNFLIFRPSLLMGPRKEQRFGERMAQLIFPVFQWLIPRKWNRYKAIHAETLAKAMVNFSFQPKNKKKEIYYYSDFIRN